MMFVTDCPPVCSSIRKHNGIYHQRLSLNITKVILYILNTLCVIAKMKENL